MTETPRGFFITFEGPDGSGKSTQARLLAERLRREGKEVLESAEPGGTPIGQKIRRILLDPENAELGAIAEMLLMFSARAQNVEQWILPALRAGKVVISDRFTDSTLAYQGAGRGVDRKTVHAVDAIACQGLQPDLTFLIDIDTEQGLQRAHARNRKSLKAIESRIDEQAIEFHHQVRAAYHEIAKCEDKRVKTVDGNASPEQVFERVWAELQHSLPALTKSCVKK